MKMAAKWDLDISMVFFVALGLWGWPLGWRMSDVLPQEGDEVGRIRGTQQVTDFRWLFPSLPMKTAAKWDLDISMVFLVPLRVSGGTDGWCTIPGGAQGRPNHFWNFWPWSQLFIDEKCKTWWLWENQHLWRHFVCYSNLIKSLQLYKHGGVFTSTAFGKSKFADRFGPHGLDQNLWAIKGII